MRLTAGISGVLSGCESFSQAPVARTRQKQCRAASPAGMKVFFVLYSQRAGGQITVPNFVPPVPDFVPQSEISPYYSVTTDRT